MWLTAFLDLPAYVFDDEVAFWLAASGTTLSAPRGEHAQFASLLPVAGDPWLRVQRLGRGPARVHLDLHAEDQAGLRDRAVRLGAVRGGDGPAATYASPGGLVFCVVTDPLSARAPTPTWPQPSRVDQVCLDIPGSAFDFEAAFWGELLGVAVTPSPTHAEFARLAMGPADPLKVLLQRCGHEDPVRAHLDLATTDRPAEVARLVALGADMVRETPNWTTLRDPAGLEFCVTDRPPPP
jgi:hypothetical protein